MSSLCIMFLTFNRPQYAERCLIAAIENIRWGGELRVHIADDGSPEEYREGLREVAGSYSSVISATASNSERGGYGKSYNLATQHVHHCNDVVLPLEDDWLLVRELDCNALVRVFEDGRIGSLRLGYLGTTQRLRGEFLRAGGLPVWLLDGASEEPHVFSGHPRLETVAWERDAGLWPEGHDPNVTEFMAAHAIRTGIAWPAWAHPDGDTYFSHIGTERAR